MTDREKYQKFIKYMWSPVWEFVESEHLMPMLESYITPEQAAFLTGFPHFNTTIEELARMRSQDPAELKPKVKELCRKGLIYEAINEDKVEYRLFTLAEMFARAPFWSGKGEDDRKALAPNFTKYYHDGFWEQHRHFDPVELRALPINQTVDDDRSFAPYEDVKKVVESAEYFTVSHCVCRERYRLDPDFEDSPAPIETCLHFDELGRYCVENGHGREITKEETLEILKEAADAGLVHGIPNHTEHPTTI